jgi:hypothetical protein
MEGFSMVMLLAGWHICFDFLDDLPGAPHRPDRWWRCDEFGGRQGAERGVRQAVRRRGSERADEKARYVRSRNGTGTDTGSIAVCRSITCDTHSVRLSDCRAGSAIPSRDPWKPPVESGSSSIG